MRRWLGLAALVAVVITGVAGAFAAYPERPV
jgi:uncharacterized protein involved in exopolysaccharide biosynthesis